MLYRWEHDGVIAYRSPLLDAIGVPHAFGTKNGDNQSIANVLGLLDRQWVTVRQVHGHAVHVESTTSLDIDSPRCDADAVVLTQPSQVTRMLTADCVPILLASTDGSKVAAVHAGWRGLVANVIEEAVDALAAPFFAAIGPCISVKHFEVGDEVAARFDGRFVRRDPGCKPHVDLRAAAHDRLQRLAAQQIDTTDRCTYEHAQDFFSHRRDVTHEGNETTGRMASVIGCIKQGVD